MKKLLSLISVAGFVTVASAAVQPTSVSFINPNCGQTTAGTLVYVPTATTGLNYNNFVNGTNVSSSQGVNANGVVTNFPPFADVPLWANGDGAINNNLNISITAVGGATATNVVDFTFARVSDGTYAGTAAGDQFTVRFTPTGATQATISTNLSSTYLQGTKELRLISIIPVSTVAGGNITFQAISVNGFAP